MAEIVPAGPQGAAELRVLCGMFRRRTVVVPVADIREIEPDRLRLTLGRELTPDVVDARHVTRRPD